MWHLCFRSAVYFSQRCADGAGAWRVLDPVASWVALEALPDDGHKFTLRPGHGKRTSRTFNRGPDRSRSRLPGLSRGLGARSIGVNRGTQRGHYIRHQLPRHPRKAFQPLHDLRQALAKACGWIHSVFFPASR